MGRLALAAAQVAATAALNAADRIETGNIWALNSIDLNAYHQIETGRIFGSGLVALNANGNIEVGFIDAQNFSGSGFGGTVKITTNGLFQAFDSFTDRNDINASVSVASLTGNGSIKIQHGGNGIIPFVVGDSSINGTAGAITTGNVTTEETISLTESFLGSHTQHNIQIITSDPTKPSSPLQFNLSQFNPPQFNPPTSNFPSRANLPTSNGGDGSGFNPESGSNSRSNTRFISDLSPDFSPNFFAIPIPVIPPVPQSSLDRFTIAETLEQEELEKAVEEIETLRKKEFEDYLGDHLPQQIMSADSIRKKLQEIAIQTGLKPAVVFALMLPNQSSDKLVLLLVRPEGEIVRANIPTVNSLVLRGTVQDFRSNLQETQMSGDLNNAQQFYDWLVQPLETALQEQEIDTLLFSLDSDMVSIPFAALHDGQQFLIEKYLFSLIPSFTLADVNYAGIANAQLAAMGVAEFPDLDPLPAVPVEVSTLADSLWSGRAFLNEDVTLSTLKTQRQQPFNMIHLATHASFQSSRQGSYIRLWDRDLRLDDLRRLNWSDDPTIELLVLSACETAIGDRNAEMGFAGLAVTTGVKSAVASLWKNDDLATLALMVEFYRHLRESPNAIKAQALQQAQLTLLRGQVRIENGQLWSPGFAEGIPLPPELRNAQGIDFNHPYFWSAFTAIGSPW